MKRKRLFVSMVAMVTVFALAIPAFAVKYGEPDTSPEMYPSVGMLAMLKTDGFFYVCSGTLIDADSVLTAGHCTVDSVAIWVNFLQTPIPFFASGAVAASDWATHPDYDDFATFPDTSDIGVVNFPAGTFAAMTPVELADVDTLTELATARGTKNTRFQIAGYGVQATNGQGHLDVFLQQRYRGEVRLINLNSANNDGANVQVTAAPGTGGALCFGDSGGPVLHEGAIVAVNSFVLNLECAGSGFAFRVDHADIQAWIAANT
ncbi:MAG: S1 family peptidase [Acidimicrobiia bacterium]